MADSSSQSVSPIDEGFVVDVPVGDFELLFCHGTPLQDRECGDLSLITAKSSIYSTKSCVDCFIVFYLLYIIFWIIFAIYTSVHIKSFSRTVNANLQICGDVTKSCLILEFVDFSTQPHNV